MHKKNESCTKGAILARSDRGAGRWPTEMTSKGIPEPLFDAPIAVWIVAFTGFLPWKRLSWWILLETRWWLFHTKFPSFIALSSLPIWPIHLTPPTPLYCTCFAYWKCLFPALWYIPALWFSCSLASVQGRCSWNRDDQSCGAQNGSECRRQGHAGLELFFVSSFAVWLFVELYVACLFVYYLFAWFSVACLPVCLSAPLCLLVGYLLARLLLLWPFVACLFSIYLFGFSFLASLFVSGPFSCLVVLHLLARFLVVLFFVACWLSSLLACSVNQLRKWLADPTVLFQITHLTRCCGSTISNARERPCLSFVFICEFAWLVGVVVWDPLK